MHTHQEVEEKEKLRTSLQASLSQVEKELNGTKERCHLAEEQVEELKRELKDMESILETNRDEITSLNEQLTLVGPYSGYGTGTLHKDLCTYIYPFISEISGWYVESMSAGRKYANTTIFLSYSSFCI